jgi:hypothetical protein
MAYKAFEDWYKEADIKHLILQDIDGVLVSPPFATELCKDYTWFKYIIKGDTELNLDVFLDLPAATSKTNTCELIGGNIWMVPYGIYDDLNFVVELDVNKIKLHKLSFGGKGQFYNLASNGAEGFSFPLGYQDTNIGLHIKDSKVTSYPLPTKGKKLHMGTVYCNGSFWSMPRGDDPGYNTLLEFNGEEIITHEIIGIDNSITRKYSDIIVKDNTLYALPFGETAGLNEIIEFNTTTKSYHLHKIEGYDFAKKYNAGVLVNDNIVALPYGEDYNDDSNWGLVFNTATKQSRQFDIGLKFGGKYRFRSGIEYNGSAYFFPAGTPTCPILKISAEGTIEKELYMKEWLLGRPIVYDNTLTVLGYNLKSKEHKVFRFASDLTLLTEIDIT